MMKEQREQNQKENQSPEQASQKTRDNLAKKLEAARQSFLNEEITAKEYDRMKTELQKKLTQSAPAEQNQNENHEEAFKEIESKEIKNSKDEDHDEERNEERGEENEQEKPGHSGVGEDYETVSIQKHHIWAGISVLLAIALIGAYFTNGYNFSNQNTANTNNQIAGNQIKISETEAASKAKEYIQNNLVEPGTEVKTLRTTEEKGLYKITVSIGTSYTTYNTYMTLDGEVFFPISADLNAPLQDGTQNLQQGQDTDTAGAVQRTSVSPDNDPSIGPENAAVTIIEFSDFECPFCARAEPAIQQVLTEYKDKVRLAYRDFPLGFHPNAQNAAEAAECANEQGKFWEYHDLLFSNQNALDKNSLKQYAAQLGLDKARFDGCLESGKYRQEIQKDRDDGEKAGVTGTPAFFINGRLLVGAQPYEEFKKIIDQEIELAAAAPPIAGTAKQTEQNQTNINNNAKNIQDTTREITIRAFKYGYEPNTIEAKLGEKIRISILNTDALHGIAIPSFGLQGNDKIEFTASTAGEFEFYCLNYCGKGHQGMKGKIIVK